MVPESQVRKLISGSVLASGMLTLTAFFLATNHVIGRSVQGEIPPLGLSFWRWCIGALILAPFVLPGIKSKLPIYRQHLPTLSLLGVLMIGSTSIVLVALNFTTAINVSLINAVQPTLTVLLAVLFYREKVSMAGFAGICSAMLGVMIMVSKGDAAVLVNLAFNAGDIATMLAMVGFSCYALNLKKLPKGLSVVEALFGITLTGTLVLLPFYLLETALYKPVPFSWSTLLVALELALLVSVLGNLMWNKGNQMIGPSRAAIFINLIPLFGAILATTFLGEKVYSYHFLGAFLICMGLWLVLNRMRVKQPAN